MKLQALDSSTKRPLVTTKILVQIKGSGGTLTLLTDENGMFQLEDRFRGQQIASVIGGTPGTSITATDGAKLETKATTKETAEK